MTERKYKNNVVIPLPLKIHQGNGLKLLHKRNKNSKPQHPRESLLQGIQDTRKVIGGRM
ncbi:hypothetical protein [Holospora obtusa]|uniref:hypothetical protein n=1 Tax=Holospora obtusa TaxID=49893 RepID=UPI0003AEAA40|nr:hypothetical protein [Holospora obtusa]